MQDKNQLVWVVHRRWLIVRGFLKCLGVVVALGGGFGLTNKLVLCLVSRQRGGGLICFL